MKTGWRRNLVQSVENIPMRPLADEAALRGRALCETKRIRSLYLLADARNASQAFPQAHATGPGLPCPAISARRCCPPAVETTKAAAR
jgi:hypothetical protein